MSMLRHDGDVLLVAERVRGAAAVMLGWTVGPDHVSIALDGRVDSAGTESVTARICELIRQFPGSTVELDLARFDELDPSVVTMLADVERCCRQSSSELLVTSAAESC